jgi:hypothetical protein
MTSSALGAFGLTFACENVRDAQEELAPLLAQAQAARLLTTHWFTADEGHPIAVNAQAVYRQVIDRNLVLFSDEACEEAASRMRAVSGPLRDLLAYAKVEQVGYAPPEDSPYASPDTLDKLKPLFIAGAVVAGVVVLAPIVYELVGGVKLFRRTKSRTGGYR